MKILDLGSSHVKLVAVPTGPVGKQVTMLMQQELQESVVLVPGYGADEK